MGDASQHVSGRWHLLREIGSGGTAVVYEATDRFAIRRRVALKVAKGADGDVHRAFYREHALLYGRQHPHLLATLALGELEAGELPGFARGAPFLVQELCAGVSGRTLERRLDDSEVATIGAQLASALAALHAWGIRHNDVTPANLLLGDEAKLIDFGLAGAGPGGVAGTLRYMAPESMAGRPVPASDVYGLAATLAHLRSGTAPSGAYGATVGGNEDDGLSTLLRDMSHHSPERRPPPESCFERFTELLQDAGTRERLRDLRDRSLRVTRSEHPALTRALAEGQWPRILCIGGAPGSGRSALLRGAVAQAVGRGLRVLGREPLPAERALPMLLADLQVTTRVNDLDQFEAIRAELTRRDTPGLLALDDLDQDRRASAFVDYLIRLGDTAPPVLVLAVSDERPADIATRSATIDEIEGLLRHVRPLRPADVNAAPELQRASGGRIGPLVDLLNRYPGDALLDAASRGTLEHAQRVLSLPPGTERAAALLAHVFDPLTPKLLDALGVDSEALELLLSAGLVIQGIDTGARTARRLRQHRGSPPSELTELLRSHPALRLSRAVLAPSSSPEVLLDAARVAARERRDEDAIELYGLAASRGTDEAAKIELAALLGARGRHEDAIAALDGAQSPRAALARATHFYSCARYREAADHYPMNAEETREEAQALRARALLLARDHDAAEELCSEALADGPGHHFRAELLDTLAMVRFYRGDSRQALALLRDALAIAETFEDERRVGKIRSDYALVLHKTGAFAEAEDAYRAALDGARRSGDFQAQLLRQINLATLLHERGKWTEALDSYERAGELARIVGDERAAIRNALNWSNLLGWLGDHERAQEIASAARERAAALGMRTDAGYLYLLEAEQRIARGTEARALLDAARERLGETALGAAECDLVEAQAALRAGNHEQARNLARSTHAVARAAQRDALQLMAATWWLMAAQTETRDLELERLGAEAQALAAKRADPDAGWLIAMARSEFASPRDKDALLANARALASDARARLSAEQERGYSAVWFRSDFWTALRSMPSAPAEVTRDFDRLLAINRELARDHDPERLLDRVIDAAIALSGAERGFIVLCPSSEGPLDESTLEIHSGRNLDRESLSGERLSRSIAARAIESRAPVTTVDASGDTRFKEALSVHELRLRSVLCLPLRTNRGVLGALYLDNRYRAHAFSDADVSLLSAFGDQAAIALANARLVSELDRNARELERMKAEVEVLNQRLERELDARHEELRHARLGSEETGPRQRHGMIGRTEAMQRIYRIVDRVADKDVTVTILGESGTGKELVARALHNHSTERSGPFVPVNCGAIPEQLLESELFGHERGAFTGAVRSKPGLFEVAADGTLFLDEIGDMPMSMQVKLLRVLQQREFRRVGGTESYSTNARVVSATHRDLEARVREGLFREDLWYRLNVVEIRVPPLRERRADLALLIDHFFAQVGFADRVNRDARAALLDYDWPGNIRELENEVQRAAALAEDRITLDDLSERLRRPAGPRTGSSGNEDLKSQVEAFERELITHALAAQGGKVAPAARALGLTRAGLYKKLHKYGLHVDKR